MTSEERCVMMEKAASMEETDISELPVGTVFHVLNGNWWGEIVTVDGKKAISFLPFGVERHSYPERTVTVYDVGEIKTSNLAHESGPKILNGPYKAVIDEIRPVLSK